MWELCNSGWTRFRTAWGRGKHKTVQDKADLNKLIYDMKDFDQLVHEKVSFSWLVLQSDDHWSKANLQLALFHRGRFNVGQQQTFCF